MTKSTLYLALIILLLHAGKFIAGQDWSSIIPPTHSPKSSTGIVVETDSLTPKQRLGMDLFYDKLLSSDNSRSCATCHNPDKGYSSGGKPIGMDGFTIQRRAPSLINRGFASSLFWDGRSSSLEDQALQPILNKTEMGNTQIENVLGRLKPKYESKFNREFSDGITEKNLAITLAEFERTIKSYSGKIDRYLEGTGELSESQVRGYDTFRGKANCYKCHPVVPIGEGTRLFTDDQFHNTGLKGSDRGRFNVTRKEEDRGRFRTPSLRGCVKTAPYMHDASLRTLEDVIEFYDRGGDSNDGDKDIQIYPLNLTPRQKFDLVEFLKVL